MNWFIEGMGCLLWGCKKKNLNGLNKEEMREQFAESFLKQATVNNDENPLKTWQEFSKDIEKRIKK